MRFLAILWAAGIAAIAADRPAGQVDRLFAKWNKPGTPGCVVGVFENGKIAYQRGYGEADLEHHVALTPSTRFYVGSISKQFTAAVIAILVREGKLNLQGSIREYLPELPAWAEPVKIENLIHHTSGIREVGAVLALSGHGNTANLTEKEFLAVLKRQRALDSAPGREHDYRNTNYILLTMIAGRVAGRPFADLATDRLFRPLGMNSTAYVDNADAIIPNRAIGYSETSAGAYHSDARIPRLIGDGGIFTTIHDLFLWDQYFYQDKNPILPPQTLLETGHLQDGTTLEYAFGLSIEEYRGRRILSHDGRFGGYVAERLQLPELNLGVVCLCNTGEASPSKLARDVVDVYAGAKLGPPATTLKPESRPVSTQPLSADDLISYPGAYRSDEADVTYRISMRSGKLFFEGAELRYVGGDRFDLDGGNLKGVRSTDGRLTGCTLSGGRLKEFPFTKVQ